MRTSDIGRTIFALSLAGLGALSVQSHDVAFVWQLAAPTLAWREALVEATSAILILGGVALLVPRTVQPAAFALAVVMLLFVLLLRLPPLIAGPLVEANWYGLSETMTFVAGAWTIFATRATRENESGSPFTDARTGQILFALTLPALGLAHFFYLAQTAPLIPSWLPFHILLAYLTGAGHIAAGVAILVGVLPRLAATLEAIMVTLFTLIIWAPATLAAPGSLYVWSELLVSLAITGTAWAVAGSFAARRQIPAR